MKAPSLVEPAGFTCGTIGANSWLFVRYPEKI